jgi:four helix bundle protein
MEAMLKRAERFEELLAWQRARALAREVYAVCQRGSFARDFVLRRQIWSAAVSIKSNIAEGFDRFGPKEFLHHLSIANGSCAELRSQLYTALDSGHLTQEAFDRLRLAAEEVSRLIAGLRAAWMRKGHKAQSNGENASARPER